MSNSTKRIYGLIGYPVKHSLSPAMHNAAFEHLDIKAEYRLFEVKPDELEEFLIEKILKDTSIKDVYGNSISTKDIYGFNITIPHKVKAREILERKFPFDKNVEYIHPDLFYVQISGAINTVKRDGDELRYWNTDAKGFLDSLEKDLGFVTKNKKVLLIGCGGTGRAIIASLSWVQTYINTIYIYDINNTTLDSTKRYLAHASERFKHFSRDNLKFISSDTEIPSIIEDCDLLINATPVGMKEGDSSLIDKEVLRICKGNLSVYDVVYNRETQLVKDAKELGIPAVGGLGMLLYQGMLSFEIWTGKTAPKDVMEKALSDGIRALN